MPKTVLFVKPPMRQGVYYFRIAQYMEYFKKYGWSVKVLAPSPDSSTLMEKLPLRQWLGKIWFLASSFPRFILDLLKSNLVFIFPSLMMSLYIVVSRLFRKKVVIDHIVSYVSHRDIF